MRFALFGTGYWARETHGAALVAHPEAELVGVWGRDPAKAEALARDLGARAYAEQDELIDAVEAVAVALPPDVQAPIAERAAAAGRHLLLDKPIALSTRDADRVLAAVQAGGVRSVVFHTARFRPEVQAWLRDVRAAGDWHGGAVTALVALDAPGNPFGQSPWRHEKGALWDVGPHALDMVLSTLGPVEDLTAAPGRGDTVHLVLRHRSGASSTLTLSFTVPEAAQTSAWWIYGPRGVWARPEEPTTPVEAFGHAISALLGEEPGDPDERPSDASYAREIVRLIEEADRRLRDGAPPR